MKKIPEPAQRKFRSEFGLLSTFRHAAILQHDGLDSEKIRAQDEETPYQIYIICRRPRLRLLSAIVDERGISGTYSVQVDEDTKTTHSFLLPRDTPGIDLTIKILENGYTVEIVTSEGEVLFHTKTGFFLERLIGIRSTDFDLEVIYIGQAYGDDGERTAPARLRQHETFQKVLAETNRRSPYYDIWITLWAVDPNFSLIASFDHRAGVKPVFDFEEDEKHRGAVLAALGSGKLSSRVVINFTEAALIKYFQPEYNVHFKKTFPTIAHKTYRECYDADLNGVSVSLASSDGIKVRLYSQVVDSAYDHVINFPLHSRADRISMFDFAIPPTKE